MTVWRYLFYEVQKPAKAPKRFFDEAAAEEASKVFSEIMKSGDDSLIERLCVLDQNVVDSYRLGRIWREDFSDIASD